MCRADCLTKTFLATHENGENVADRRLTLQEFSHEIATLRALYWCSVAVSSYVGAEPFARANGKFPRSQTYKSHSVPRRAWQAHGPAQSRPIRLIPT